MLSHQQARRLTHNSGQPRWRLFREDYGRLMTVWSKQHPPTKMNNLELAPYERELTLYLRESRLPQSTDIYAFWHCSQYACLTPAAHKYLSAPLTSVPSEQLFSAAGQLYTDRRSNLNSNSYFFWRTTFVCLALIIRPDDCTRCLNDVMQWCVNYFLKVNWLWVCV